MLIHRFRVEARGRLQILKFTSIIGQEQATVKASPDAHLVRWSAQGNGDGYIARVTLKAVFDIELAEVFEVGQDRDLAQLEVHIDDRPDRRHPPCKRP